MKRVLLAALALLLAPALQAAPGDILFQDDFTLGLGINWQSSGPGEVGRNTQTANSPTRSAYLREDTVSLTSRAGNISAAVPGADFDVWIRRGSDSFSEDPDTGEDLVVEYLNVANNWITLETFAGDGTPGEIYTRTYVLAADALHAGLRLRFTLTSGNVNNGDYWHIDDVIVTETGPPGPVPPIAEWRLDETSWNGTPGEALDSSGNGLHGRALNGATPVPAQVCNGASLGGGSYLEIVDDPLLDIPGELTVTSWIRPNSIPGSGLMSIVSKDENFEFHIDSGGQIFWWWSTNTLTTTGAPLSAGNWYHIAIVYSQSGASQSIYIDGVRRASATFAGALPQNNDPVHIGADQGFAGREFDGLIDEVRIYEAALSQASVQTVMAETRPCATPATPVAEWRFDEGAWNGSAGEVVDSSGNDYHGSASNSNPVPGLLCNAADLSANSTTDYLDMDAAAMNGLGDFSVSVWAQTTSNADSTIVSAASGNSSLQANEAVMYFDGANRFWPTISDSPFDTATRFNIGAFNSGTWRHMVWTREAATRQSCFYLDGALQGCTTHPDANDSNPLTVVNGGLIIGQDQDSLGGGFDITQDWQGLLDELTIFPRVLALADIQSIRSNNLAGNNWDGTPRICAALAQLQITVAPNASTCVASSVTVQALDGLGNPLTGYTGTIDLTTSTGNGNWLVTTGGGTLLPSPDTDDNGAASYTFVAADSGSVTFDLSNAHADDLTITVQDTSASVSATSGLVSFRDNAFVITNNEFAYPVAGRDHAYDVTLWQRDTSLPTPDCQIATGYSGVRNLDGWYDPTAAHPAGADAPAVVQGGPAFVLGQGVAAAVPVDLTFNNGVAGFSLRTTDVGQYTLNLRDDTAGFATVTITGATAAQTVRPFGFAITGIAAAGANPGGTTPGDLLFNAAGDPFRASFQAVRYGVGDPLDANGNPTSWIALEDNLAARSFAWATQLGGVLNTPAAGVAGVLDRPGSTQITAAEFANGGALPADLRYSEVGSMFMSAGANNYLGVPGLLVQGRSQAVGRFSPAEFNVVGNVPTYDAACTAFTYLDQPFDYSAAARPVATITAVNAQGGITSNYFDFGGVDDWWLLGDIAETYADPVGDLVYSGAGASHNSSAIPTANGQVVVTFVGTLTYNRTLPYADGAGIDPFNAAPAMSFTVTDADGVTFNGGAAFTFAINEAIGQNGVRHGRLRLQSAHGSEVLDLPAPLTLQTFDGTNFTTTTDDNCTAVAVADFTYVGVPVASAVTPFAAGDGSLDWQCSVASPCATGFVDVTGALGVAGLGWLRYDWDGDDVEDEPSARVTFGIHAGSNRNIHIRELF